MPVIKVDGSNPVQIEVISNAPFPYQSFRLHDPERFVVDFGCDFVPEKLPVIEKAPHLPAYEWEGTPKTITMRVWCSI